MDKRNWLDVNEYLLYLREVKHLDLKTTERYRSYFKRPLRWAGDESFSRSEKIRPSLIEYMQADVSQNTHRPLAFETWRKTVMLLASFFRWEKSWNKDYKQVSEKWIQTLEVPKTVRRVTIRDYVTLESILRLKEVGQSNINNLVLFRDTAAALFLFLSGIRASAFVSLPIKAVNLDEMEVYQDPRLGVRTKFSKSETTLLWPIPELLDFIKIWDSHVRRNLPPTALWFAPIRNEWGEKSLSSAPAGLRRGQLLNRRLKGLFRLAGLRYQSAHKFRHGHTHWAYLRCRTIGDLKVVSQNLMHENIVTTDQIYGGFTRKDRREIVAGFADREGDSIYNPQLSTGLARR